LISLILPRCFISHTTDEFTLFLGGLIGETEQLSIMKKFTFPNTILLFILSCLSTGLFAQTVNVTGLITDQQSGEPLLSATVRAGEAGTTTDLEGNFMLALNPGNHTLYYSYVGYETGTMEIQVKADQPFNLNLQLAEITNILQTATVTSGRYEKPLGEVTVSLEVIKPALIDNTNASSVDQVLDKVPGVNIIDGQPNIRGGSGWSYGAGSRVLVLIDDIPILQADAGKANWGDIPVENIEQIEVVKGAASALYGSSAMNGIINIRTAYAKSKPVTKFSTYYTGYMNPADKEKIWWDGDPEQPVVPVLCEGPISDTCQMRTNYQPYAVGISASHRQKFGKFDLVLSSFVRKNQSYRENNYGDHQRFNIGTRYRINDRLSIGLNGNFNTSKNIGYFYWLDGGAGAYRANATEQTGEPSRRLRYTLDPFITYFDKSGNRHKLQGRFYNVDNKNTENQSNASKLYYGEYQFQKKFDKIGLVTTAGVVGTRTNVRAELYGDTTFTSNNLAGFLQLEKKIGTRLNISGGVRYERNTQLRPEIFQQDTLPGGKLTESRPIFRLGASYQIGRATFLRASYGQGYRYPTIAERFITTQAAGLNIAANPKLNSETGWSGEFGIKQGFKIGGFSGFVDASAFWTEYQDMIEFNLFNVGFLIAFQARNIGDTRIRGLELSMGGQGDLWGMPTTLLAGYTFTDPRFKVFDDEANRTSSADYNILKYRFRHNVKFDLETQLKAFSLGVAANYTSRMEAIDNVLTLLAGIGEFRESHDTGVLLLGVRAAYRPFDGAKVSLLANNLLNKEYSQRPGLLEAPRNVTVRLDYEF